MRRAILCLILLCPAAGHADEITPIAAVQSITATSVLKGYPPMRMLRAPEADNGMPPQSAWCEGRPDEGIGESVTVTFEAPVTIATVGIMAGFWKSPELFRANNIVTGLAIRTDDGRVKDVVLPARQEKVTVDLGGGPVRRLTFVITKVIKGRMNDSCISLVTLYTEPPSLLAIGLDPALPAAILQVEQALRSCDEASLGRTVAFPFHLAPRMAESDGDVIVYQDAHAMSAACKAGRSYDRDVPGLDAEVRDGVTYLQSASCGNGCQQWGFARRSNRLVWMGPTWVVPRP
jgi:hypothetical protein